MIKSIINGYDDLFGLCWLICNISLTRPYLHHPANFISIAAYPVWWSDERWYYGENCRDTHETRKKHYNFSLKKKSIIWNLWYDQVKRSVFVFSSPRLRSPRSCVTQQFNIAKRFSKIFSSPGWLKNQQSYGRIEKKRATSYKLKVSQTGCVCCSNLLIHWLFYCTKNDIASLTDALINKKNYRKTTTKSNASCAPFTVMRTFNKLAAAFFER